MGYKRRALAAKGRSASVVKRSGPPVGEGWTQDADTGSRLRGRPEEKESGLRSSRMDRRPGVMTAY